MLFLIASISSYISPQPTALTTMDITTDGFGFMLAVGDLMWVPFTYTLQTRYLVFNPIELGMMKCLAIFAVNALGVYIFRTSNSEKNDFRNGQNPKSTSAAPPSVFVLMLCLSDLKYMTTESGSKLLISGWWGFSRHSNYLYVFACKCEHKANSRL
jgi:delta14-sterol reductase